MFKKTRLKRFCSFLVAIVVLCGTFVLTPQTVMAATDIFVGGSGAVDTNDGLTPGTPVATLEKALDLVNPVGVIHVQGNISAHQIPSTPATVPTTVTDLTIIGTSPSPLFKITGYLNTSATLDLKLQNIQMFGPIATANQPTIAMNVAGPVNLTLANSTVESENLYSSPNLPNIAIHSSVPLTIKGDGNIIGGGNGIFTGNTLDIEGTSPGLKIKGGIGTAAFSVGAWGIHLGGPATITGLVDVTGGNGDPLDAAATGGNGIHANGQDITISDDATTSIINITGGDGPNGGTFGIDEDSPAGTSVLTFEEIPAKFHVKGGLDTDTPPVQPYGSAMRLYGSAPIVYPSGFPTSHLAYSILGTTLYTNAPEYLMVNTTINGTANTDIPVVAGVPSTITAPAHFQTNPSVAFGDIKYQWEKSTDGGTTWTVLTAADVDYTGINTATLNIASTSATQGHQYRCGLGNHVYAPKATLKVQEPAPITTTIDYVAEELIMPTANVNYKINNVSTPAIANRIAIPDAWMNAASYNIIKEGIPGNNTTDSLAFTLTIPVRPTVPSVTPTNETVIGANDGIITGVTTAMEWKPSASSTWTACTSTTITGLPPGSYDVRVAALNPYPTGNFCSLPSTVNIGIGSAPTYTLNVTAPIFAPVTEGYTTQPAPQPIVINSTGNSASTISSVTVNTSDFIIGGSGTTVTTGGSLSTWTVQPAAGLPDGTYTDTITVTYNNGATATATVTFVVNPTFTATAVSDPVIGGTSTVVIGSGTPSSSATDLAGTTVVLNAIPASDYTFDHWEVSDPSATLLSPATSATNSFVLPSTNVTVTAYYNEIPNTISVNAIPASAGNATVTVGGVTGSTASSISNANININATPNYGFQFDHWDINGSAITLNNPATDATNSFNMPALNVTLTAHFIPATPYNITLTTNIAGAGTPIATTSTSVLATTAIETDTVNIASAPAPGYEFIGWTVVAPSGLTLANLALSSTSFVMPANNVEIMANFRLIPTNTPKPTSPPIGNIDNSNNNGEDTTIYATPRPTATQKPTIEPTHKPSVEPSGQFNNDALMNGYPDENFHPLENITRAEIAQVIYNAKYTGGTSTDTPYTDIVEDVWYEEAVNFAYAEGYMIGYPDGTFKPNEPITRAEALTVIDGLSSLDSYEGEDLFTDIEGHWANEQINRAAYALDIQGYPDGTYKPDDNIIRGDFAILLAKVTDRVEYLPEVSFNDVFEADYYYEEVMAVSNPTK